VAFWVQPDDPPLRLFEMQSAMRGGGFPSREAIVARYEERSGRSARDIRFYHVLALWKLVPAMEGLYRQALAGQVSNPYLEGFGPGVAELVDHALELAHLVN
jgi:aminoglycoside phosphotransferase (APT) family kinase protein